MSFFGLRTSFVIDEDSEVILILHLRGLKFLKHNFYCDCYISQIKLFQDTIESKYTIMKEYSLIDEEDEQIQYDDIFNEEIVNAFEEEKRLKKEKAEEEERLKKEKAERIELLRKEIEMKNKEMEELIE